jgi:hypothetical protein
VPYWDDAVLTGPPAGDVPAGPLMDAALVAAPLIGAPLVAGWPVDDRPVDGDPVGGDPVDWEFEPVADGSPGDPDPAVLAVQAATTPARTRPAIADAGNRRERGIALDLDANM